MIFDHQQLNLTKDEFDFATEICQLLINEEVDKTKELIYTRYNDRQSRVQWLLKFLEILLFNEKLNIFENVLKIFGQDEFEDHCVKVRGMTFYAKGNLEQAIYKFKEHLVTCPEDWFCIHLAGISYYLLDEKLQAIEYLEKSVELNPQFDNSWSWLANTYWSMNQYTDCLEALNNGIKVAKQFGWLLTTRGFIHYCGGEHELAYSDFARALESECSEDDYLKILFVYEEKFQWEQGLTIVTTALEKFPDSEALTVKRACFYKLSSQYELAQQDLIKVLNTSPNNLEALVLLYEIYETLNNADKLAEIKFKLSLYHDQFEVEDSMKKIKKKILDHLKKHFAPHSMDELSIIERKFPLRVRADLQITLNHMIAQEYQSHFSSGVTMEHSHYGIDFASIFEDNRHYACYSTTTQYEEINIGNQEFVKCMKHGFWLLSKEGDNLALLWEPLANNCGSEGLRLQICSLQTERGQKAAQDFFKKLEEGVSKSDCYRGKILSLEIENNYQGYSSGITVHQLKEVNREQVILPDTTLDMLERNVIKFVKQRPRLRELGMSTKKGLLFYGPPGTGKTHTIHYLTRALPDHTTLLVTSAQVVYISEYMTLARLLQPALVILEDVDLIGRSRDKIEDPFQESMLNRLLNEMDGLKQNVDIIFILTTNRPETLEEALASRPGRIDQSIEFPLPDEIGRRKLIQLHSSKIIMSPELIESIVKRTEGVSAAFICELMRRIVQYHIEFTNDGIIKQDEIDYALDDMLHKGSLFNRRILGGSVSV